MHITIKDIEYEFKNEPTSRDLIKIGLPPKFYQECMLYQQKLKIELESYEALHKDKDKQLWPPFESKLEEPVSKDEDADYKEIIIYNGRILNTLYLGNDIEDWLDMPKSILDEAMVHPKILKLMGMLYG